ncbi:hypothetical protein GCM10027184_59590 [Saccharothrix stipae]
MPSQLPTQPGLGRALQAGDQVPWQSSALAKRGEPTDRAWAAIKPLSPASERGNRAQAAAPVDRTWQRIPDRVIIKDDPVGESE